MLRQVDTPPLLSTHAVGVAVVFDSGLAGHATRYGLAMPSALVRAVPKRRAEFLAGRYCAREALATLGFGNVGTLEVRADRSPQWPAGIMGAITHTHGFAWAAATADQARGGIGIDSETIPSEAIAREIRSAICSKADDALLSREVVPRWGDAAAVCLALSARESFFKCLAGCNAAKPEPSDLCLSAVDLSSDSFRLRLTKSLSDEWHGGREVEGRVMVTPPLVHTAIEW